MTTASRLRTLGVWDSVETIAQNHGVSVEEMLGRRRFAPMVAARYQLWLHVRENVKPQLSYPKLATLFGACDHTHIWYGCKQERERNDRTT